MTQAQEFRLLLSGEMPWKRYGKTSTAVAWQLKTTTLQTLYNNFDISSHRMMRDSEGNVYTVINFSSPGIRQEFLEGMTRTFDKAKTLAQGVQS
jgi:hypothetical protein